MMDAERQRIINEAARIANNIDQHIIDAEYWNELHPDEEPLVADPDGQRRADAERDAVLAYITFLRDQTAGFQSRKLGELHELISGDRHRHLKGGADIVPRQSHERRG